MQNFNIEVYQPRASSQYLEDDNRTTRDGFEEIYNDLRDLKAGMMDADDIDHDTFGRLYNLAGTDTVEATDHTAALHKAFEQWNNGSGHESDSFRQANAEHRAVSLSSGHIVRVDGTTYFCEMVGWEKIEF